MSLYDITVEKARSLRDRGLLAEARELLEGGMAEKPLSAAAASLLGHVCGLQGDHPSAAKYLETAVALEPDNLEAWFLLGVTYENAGRFEASLASFERVRSLEPEMALPLRWMGLVLTELGRAGEALECYQEALRINPAYEEALVGLASLHIRQHRLEEAERTLTVVLADHPGNVPALNELSRIYRLQGRSGESLGALRSALQSAPDSRMIVNNLLYALCDLDTLSPESIALEHFELADRLYPPLPESGAGIAPLPALPPDRPIRIGYLSGDFFTHSVAAFIEPILIHHDPALFSVYCYSNTHKPDETTERLQRYPVVWREIYGRCADSVAALMREDGIDILVELSGHTSGNRLDVCALKPAPIIVSWLGYPHSAGLSQIDYYLTDAVCDPPGMTDHLYRERLWRLPRVFSCYLPPVTFPEVRHLPQNGSGNITFGCFNNYSKVTDSVLALWAEVLRRVERSRLCLKNHAVSGEALQSRIRDRFLAAGITADRVIFHAYTDTRYQHMALYGTIDIALDTYPYHGTTTTCEAMWMGVPVVTLAGRTHASRVGASLLTSVGLADLVADSPEQYVAAAFALAGDRPRRERLREQLRRMMAESPLMDAEGITREVEAAYKGMMELFRSSRDQDDTRGTAEVRPAALPVPEPPDDFARLVEQGKELFDSERFSAAEEILARAVAQEPQSASCRLMLASSLQALGRPEEALHHYRYLLRFESQQLADMGRSGAMAYCLAATAAYESGREEYAYELCSQALELAPDLFIARFRRCLFSLKMCSTREELESVRERYAGELSQMVQLDLAEGDLLEQAVAAIGEMSPFFVPYLGGNDRILNETYGQWLCSVMARKYPEAACRIVSAGPITRRLRIGFVSAHFYNHSVWKIITRGWLEQLDRDKFELFCYYPGSTVDHATRLAMAASTRFIQSTCMDELVQVIRGDEADVLIYPGIGMDPYAQQLAALRLAPVQCASWGHPVTSGMPTIDYFLSSDLMEPDDAEEHYSERLVRLPNLSVCYPDAAPDVDEHFRLPEDVPQDDTLYLCCQNLHKYLPQHDDLFPAIAAEIPNARFIFLNSNRFLKDRFMHRMESAFAAYGLAADDHIRVLPLLATSGYNALNSKAHIYLDNLEWSGGNTTLESLPFDKPIVTMPGRFMRGRHTTAILQMMGVPELIACTKEEFISLAVRLAKEPAFYRAMSDKIRTHKQRVYNDGSCITVLEHFLQSRFDTHQEKACVL